MGDCVTHLVYLQDNFNIQEAIIKTKTWWKEIYQLSQDIIGKIGTLKGVEGEFTEGVQTTHSLRI